MSQLRNKKMKIVFESLQFEKFSLSLFFFFFGRGRLVEKVKRLKMSWQENENSLLDQETKVYFYFHFLKRYKRQRQCVCFYYFHFPNVKRKRERVCGLKRLGRIGGVIDVDCRQIDCIGFQHRGRILFLGRVFRKFSAELAQPLVLFVKA